MEALQGISLVQVIGAICVIIGYAFRYWVNRRRFNRTSYGGVQLYQSYEHKVAFTLIERLVRFVGLALILFGLFLIFAEVINHHYAKHPVWENQHHKQTQQ